MAHHTEPFEDSVTISETICGKSSYDCLHYNPNYTLNCQELHMLRKFSSKTHTNLTQRWHNDKVKLSIDKSAIKLFDFCNTL